jgi:hypothetical protein
MDVSHYKCSYGEYFYNNYIKSKIQNMLHFEQPIIDSHQKDQHDSFGFGKSSVKRTHNFYEKCALQCVNMASSLTQQ